MLTLGSQQRNIDFESVWRKKMHAFLDPAHASKKAKGSALAVNQCILHHMRHLCLSVSPT